MAAARKTVNGPPGEVWSNLTGKVWYQRLCDFHHSCGLCIRLHRLIAARWDLPTHPGCTCRVVVVPPGDDALPFVDFAESLADLPEPARIRAVGASNWRLIKAGLVSWEDVVTPARVRSFAEVVKSKRLDGRALARAGIPAHLIPGAKARPKPAPKVKPGPRRPVVTVAGPGGRPASFIPARDLREDQEVVLVDPARFDVAWRLDEGYHVGPGGAGGIGGRYEGFGAWLRAHPDTPIEMPSATFQLDAKARARAGRAGRPEAWQVGIDDGRHRFAWLRDHGYGAVPLVVPRRDAADFRARFGPTPEAKPEAKPVPKPVPKPKPKPKVVRPIEDDDFPLIDLSAEGPTGAVGPGARPVAVARAPEVGPGPEGAAPGRGATITRSDLEGLRRALAAPGLDRPSRKNAVVREWLLARQPPETSDAQRHGMGRPEAMARMSYEGLHYHFPPVKPDDLIHPMVVTIRNLVADVDLPPLPAALTRQTPDIYLSTQKSRYDPHWEKEYNHPGFTSNASGGEGAIVLYNGSPIGRSTLAHEAGHGLAGAKYGSYRPRPSSDFARAASSGEPPPTEYGQVDIQEDFADSIREYCLDAAALRAVAPRRYEVIHRLMTEESYGG